jgi:hypothetical protein
LTELRLSLGFGGSCRYFGATADRDLGRIGPDPVMAPKGATWRSFAEARAFVRALGLKSRGEWRAYCHSGQKPADIPSTPERAYRTEWGSLGDWLGTDTIAHRNRQYRPFAEARAFVRTLGLTAWSAKVWSNATCRSENGPGSRR